MKINEKLTGLSEKSREKLQPTIRVFGESRTVQVLSGVLALQIVVAGGLLWKSGTQAQFAPATQLVSIDPSTVDELIINDGDDSITLVRADEQWRMNDEHNTLASVDKINKLVADITDLRPGLPVTSTRGAHQQLEVSEDNFQRQVTLKAGDEIVADLYMGTSPGFRKSHVRQSDQDQVFAARLNTFDIPADHEDWLDNNLLSFSNISGLQSEGLDLALENDQWSINAPEDRRETHQVDKPAVDKFVSQLTALRVNGFAQPLEVVEPSETEQADDNGTETAEAEELLTHTITVVQDETPITLVLSKLGSDVTIERSDIPGVFSLPVTTYDALSPEVVQALLIDKESDDSEEGSLPQG